MSGYPNYPGGYQPPTSIPAMPPGGPPAGQFLAALQAITTALNTQAAALNRLLTPPTPAVAANRTAAATAPIEYRAIWLHLPETDAPDPPADGAILYVDNSSKHLMAVKADGTRHILA